MVRELMNGLETSGIMTGDGFESASEGSLLDRIAIFPITPDEGRGQLFLNDLLEDAEVGESLKALICQKPKIEGFLTGIMCNTSYLRDLMRADPGRLVDILNDNPESRIERTVKATIDYQAAGEADLMIDLRKAKQDMALTIGLGDIGGALDLNKVTCALTAFADASLTATIRYALGELAKRGKFNPHDANAPEIDSGLIVLAMGKHGAYELNYSSDIDLIILFDREKAPIPDSVEPQTQFVRLVRRLVKIMQERTADGYVFRTDLRLRPDIGSNPLAMPSDLAVNYYKTQALTWERTALIKARACAGDIAAGEMFLHNVAPSIWSRNLSFASIADVQDIKRKIHMHKGHSDIAVAGHNVKLGRGGIREIEFLVQTRQIVAGGRNPSLRGRRTLDMLNRLCETGWVREDARDELSEAYGYLRNVEHRIQMLNDEQTQLLPKSQDGLDQVAYLMGCPDFRSFEEAILERFNCVKRHYEEMFEDESVFSPERDRLNFSGDGYDADTVKKLGKLGYGNPETVIDTVRNWQAGTYRSTRSENARERLEELNPVLFSALAATDNADDALSRFDAILSKMPRGVQFFALLRSNPQIMNLLATTVGSAPRFAEIVAQRPQVLDSLLDPSFLGVMPSVQDYNEFLDRMLADARTYEQVLNQVRFFAQEQQFLIGIRVLANTLKENRAGLALSRLVDVIVERLLRHVFENFTRKYGNIPGGSIAILAVGKLGGQEMTVSTNLQFVLVYELPKDEAVSDGTEKLKASVYYRRLALRFIAAVSAPTSEGALYPAGINPLSFGYAGPLVTRLDRFAAYQNERASTLELMDLTRMRVIASSSREFAFSVFDRIGECLKKPRDKIKLANEFRLNRKNIEREKSTKDLWNLRFVSGGVVDIEHIAQYLQICHAHETTVGMAKGTEQALEFLHELGLLETADFEILIDAFRLYQRLEHVLCLAFSEKTIRESPAAAIYAEVVRVTLSDETATTDSPLGIIDLLVQVSGFPSFDKLEYSLAEYQRKTREIFLRIIGDIEID